VLDVSNLLTQLASWKPFTALVVGDVMLDQHVYGDADRMTADAPVPVLNVRRTEQMPGGAANVCMDLVAMHGKVKVFGITGDDPEATTLARAMTDSGVDTSGLVRDPSRPTTVKRSLVGLAQHRHPQKMFRVDHESTEPPSQAILDELLARFDAALPDADVVCIEDYNKGVCAEPLCRAIIARCKRAGKPVLVDPARLADYSRYVGCTAITPNRTEAEAATGLQTHGEADPNHNAQLARALQQQLNAEAIVLTLDRHGALLLERDAELLAVPTVARQVYDVTGAGDMVLAALAAARANGIDWPDAVRFANAAAGLEVEVFGVQPIPLERIHSAILHDSRRLLGKGRTLEEALIEVSAARRDGRRIVFTNGVFDLLHAGHVKLLRTAADMGDLLVVGINSDESTRRLKGPERPINSQDDRVFILSELESVDIVIVFDDDTPIRLIEAVRPEVLVKGGDYTKDKVVGAGVVESYGGVIALVEFAEGRSTTSAIERIRGR